MYLPIAKAEGLVFIVRGGVCYLFWPHETHSDVLNVTWWYEIIRDNACRFWSSHFGITFACLTILSLLGLGGEPYEMLFFPYAFELK